MTSPSHTLRIKLVIVMALAVLTAGSLAAEIGGILTRHEFRLGGDLRRESHVFGQYGQAASAILIALLVWNFDPSKRRMLVPFGVALLATAATAAVMKHVVGRARPDKGDAAEFRGPATETNSERESFPSGHSATAVATSVVLAALYPRQRRVFWGLAFTCAALRYVNNAHWPSDIFAGMAVGYIIANLVWRALAVAPSGSPTHTPRTQINGHHPEALAAPSR
jgi:membrane-associated phospholipid phosphatase